MPTPTRIDSTHRRDTDPTERTAEERAHALVTSSRDPHFAMRARAFFASSEVRSLSAEKREQMVDALERMPTEEAVERLSHLATDTELRSGPGASWSRTEIDAAARGVVRSPESLARFSGTERRHGEAWPGLVAVGGGTAHLAELGAEIAAHGDVAEFVAGAGAVVGLALFVVEAVHGVEEAHIEGARDARRTNFGIGFANEITTLTGGPPMPIRHLPGQAEGASVARQLWDGLRPSERAILQSMSPSERRDFHVELTRMLERRTIGGGE